MPPPGAAAGRATPAALVARNFSVQVRAAPYVWATGLIEPLLYLLSIGVGLGHLVGRVPGPGGRPVPYADFVAPGLLATSAMNGAIYECTGNIFAKLHWTRLYDAVIATPLAPGDIALAEIGFATFRCAALRRGLPGHHGRPGRHHFVVGSAGAALRHVARAPSPPPVSRPRASCARGPTSTRSPL